MSGMCDNSHVGSVWELVWVKLAFEVTSPPLSDCEHVLVYREFLAVLGPQDTQEK